MSITCRTLVALSIWIGTVATPSGCQATEPASTQSDARLESEREQVPIEDFVRRTYIHGLPYQETAAYGSSVLSKLREMLADPAEAEHWSNVVVALCILGGERELETIQNFIGENGSEALSRASYAAKTNAITALGYFVFRTESREALDYLKQGLEPSTWSERIHWQSPYHSSPEERNVQLAQMSVMALALSGHPEGRAALEDLKTEATRSGGISEINNLLDEAIETNAFVRREGLARYLVQRTP